MQATRKSAAHPFGGEVRQADPNAHAGEDDLDALIGVTAAEVSQRPPKVSPDVYAPSTASGSEALTILAEKFGRFATLPP